MKIIAPLKCFSLSINNYVVTNIPQFVAFNCFLTFFTIKKVIFYINIQAHFALFHWAAWSLGGHPKLQFTQPSLGSTHLHSHQRCVSAFLMPLCWQCVREANWCFSLLSYCVVTLTPNMESQSSSAQSGCHNSPKRDPTTRATVLPEPVLSEQGFSTSELMFRWDNSCALKNV